MLLDVVGSRLYQELVPISSMYIRYMYPYLAYLYGKCGKIYQSNGLFGFTK